MSRHQSPGRHTPTTAELEAAVAQLNSGVLSQSQPPERWVRLSKRDGSTAVLELVTQAQSDGTIEVVSRTVRVQRDIRPVQYAKAMQALEENAG